jgi:hypothetical protein
MRSFAQLEAALDHPVSPDAPVEAATSMLHVGEEALENFLLAKGKIPVEDQIEGFRLLALHAQGSADDPSFDSCVETARELVYQYNLIRLEPEHADTTSRLKMMQIVARHLVVFVGGKLEVAELGNFCCAAKPIRLNSPESLELLSSETPSLN